ncbi:MAG: sensor histidine kinase [Pseudolabrys sp.]
MAAAARSGLDGTSALQASVLAMSLTLVASRPIALSAPWAHDIRNALAVASLHLETLERLAGASGRKAASAAQATLRRAAGLCNASLDEPGALEPRRRTVDLMPVLREICAQLGALAPPKLKIRIPSETHCLVTGDVTDLYRALFNLLQNAVTAARHGAVMHEIRIDIVRDEAIVVVTIADDGPGLPAGVRRNLFRRGTRSASGGSGFGIAIARELAERNGARLTLDQAAPGTRYRLELAAAPRVAQKFAAAV